MLVDLTDEEIKIVQKCVMSVEYSRMALNLGDTDKLYDLFQKLEKTRKQNDKNNEKE